MRFEDLARRAGQQAREAGRRVVRPSLAGLKGTSRRYRLAGIGLGGAAAAALVLVVALLWSSGGPVPLVATTLSPSLTSSTTLVSPFPTYVESRFTWSQGECSGADQVLRGDADALPMLGQTDEERVRSVASELGLDLESRFSALYYRVVPRAGQVWTRDSNGDVDVIDVDDYQLELVLPDATNCPSAPYDWNGIPVVFTITDTAITSTSTSTIPSIESDAIPIDVGPLEARTGHSVIWTGTEMIVWGGQGNEIGTTLFADGAAYDLATEAWRSLAAAPLTPRRYHIAAWTGQEMLTIGGVHERDGATYDPMTDTWRPIAESPIPIGPTSGGPIEGVTGWAWTGDRLVVWYVPTGEVAAYSPNSDSWALLPSPGFEVDNGALRWNGNAVYAFGANTQSYSDTALRVARLDGDQWTQLASADLSTEDTYIGGVPTLTAWDGQRFVAWSDSGSEAKTLALNPESGVWSEIASIPIHGCEGQGAPVQGGDEVIAFGSCDSSVAFYDPLNDAWKQYTIGGSATSGITVWTGTQLIDWGDDVCCGSGAPFKTEAWIFTPPN
jgi:hypothetical protein